MLVVDIESVPLPPPDLEEGGNIQPAKQRAASSIVTRQILKVLLGWLGVESLTASSSKRHCPFETSGTAVDE